MAAKKKASAAPTVRQHQRESDYLSPAQKKVFKSATPRVAKVAPSETKAPAKRASAKTSSAKKPATTASPRKRAAKKSTATETPAAAE